MYLITPLKNEDIEGLRAGDIIYLSGTVCTARDKAHERALEQGSFPCDIKNGVVFHAGPVVEKKVDGTYSIVSIGPTTSGRMNALEPAFIESFGVSAIIGKGGMDRKVADSMKGRAVYLAMTGGCAAITSSQVKEVKGVEWLDLGVPEAVWILEVEKLGPLIVGIDSRGNSIYETQERKIRVNLEKITKKG